MVGREVELFIGATDASPDSAVRAARKVVEKDGVDIVIGPLSGSEGISEPGVFISKYSLLLYFSRL